METVILIAVPAILVVLVVVMKRKKSAKPPVYVCDRCNETDCDCNKQPK